ncbi:hypothetical protein E6P97_02675 [Patescibacteria group bacterium]|nr:MAG: hypothetical protein E6P97_02675 [Patescibacteria group bacterium]
MINLLPPRLQKEIRAAHSNTLLLRYIILLVCSLAFMIGALAITYFTINQAVKRADTTKQENEQKAAGYLTTQSAATKLRSDLSAAKTLFDNEIRYSKVITRFSGLLPNGAAVDSFQVTDASFSQPMNVPVRIRDRSAAEALQTSFMSSPYVTNDSIGSIQTEGGSSAYPYIADLRFTFTRSITQ